MTIDNELVNEILVWPLPGNAQQQEAAEAVMLELAEPIEGIEGERLLRFLAVRNRELQNDNARLSKLAEHWRSEALHYTFIALVCMIGLIVVALKLAEGGAA